MQSSDVASEVVIVAGDFVQTGGMDRANYALAEHLSATGRHVELVAHRVAPELARHANVAVRRVPKPLDSYVLGEPLLDHFGRLAARSALPRGGVTLVNGGNAAVPGVNWVHYVHAAYQPRERWNARGVRRSIGQREARRRERAALAVASRVIANSHATKRALLELLGLSEELVHVVYYGVDRERFGFLDADAAAEARRRLGFADRPLVAFIGALGDERKGFDTLFEAWRMLCHSPSWDADLIAIGAGAELPRFRARAAELGMAQRVRMLGFRTDVPELLAACDALVAPTRYEAFGLGVAEALARGLPALVSASAGVAELYPTELHDLLLDDPESAADLARSLLAWREHLEEQRARVRALSDRVRARSWTEMAVDITRHLDAVPRSEQPRLRKSDGR